MYKMILVGYDGSENAKQAINRAIDEAKESKGELRIVVVADSSGYPMYAGVGVYKKFRDGVAKHAKNLLSDAIYVAKSAGVTNAYGTVEDGQPTDMILTVALECKADLIVVGRRGRRGIERFLLGSVSSSVVSHSKCDVLVVK